MALGCTLALLGELVTAQPLMEHALALYDPEKHPRPTVNTADPRVDCLCYLSWTLLSLGYPDQGLKCIQQVIALAEGLSHPFSLAYALGNAASFHLMCREEQLAQARTEEVIVVSTEQGFPYWLEQGMCVRGAALAAQGRVAEGIAQMQQGLDAFQVMGAEIQRRIQLPLLAAAHARSGQVEEGLGVVDEALALVDKTGMRVGEEGLHVLKGWVLLAQSGDNQGDAEACFRQALEIARRQDAKLPELNAVMSLARLWQQQGKHREAHQMLSEIYNWFTEGFDTKDLQEAKALLEELGEIVKRENEGARE